MTFIDSLPTYTLVLPALLVVGAWLLSKILRFSMWATLLVGCLPFVLPYLDLPFSREFLDANPLYLIGGGWALLFCFALGRAIVSPALGENGRNPAGVVRAAFGVVLGVALLVVALLVSRPEILESTFPGWKGGAGLVLLCASLLSMSLWLARVLKAAIVFSLWSIVSLVLASELFLNKLPYEVVREDLRHLQPLASRFGLEDALKQVETFASPIHDDSSSVSEKIRAYVLGVSPNTGYLFPKERSFARALQGVLERQGVSAEVKDGTSFDASSVQMQEIAARQIAPLKPDVVVIMGWGADTVRGRNSYGIPGLSELAAKKYVENIRALHRYPFAADVVESVLYRYGTNLMSPTAAEIPLEALPYRVSPEEFKREMLSTVKSLNEAGSQVILLPEPVAYESESEYRVAMQQVAQETKAAFIPVDELLSGDPKLSSNGRLFARGRILSQLGYDNLATLVIPTLVAKTSKGGAAIVPNNVSNNLPSNVPTQSVTFASVGGALPTVDGGSIAPIVREEVSLLVDPNQVRGDLIFRIKIAEQGTRFYRVVFSVNGEFVADRRLDSRDETRVRFSLPPEAKKYSVVELTLRTVASPPPNEDLIGTTDQFAPTPLQVTSDPSGVSMVKVGRRAFFARSRGAGAVALSIDLRSGDIINSIRSEDAAEVAKWILNQPWGSIVATSLQFTKPEELATLRPALKFIGASNLPLKEKGGNSVIGVTGTKKGEARTETTADGSATVTIGSEILKSYAKFTLFDVTTGGKEFSRPSSNSERTAGTGGALGTPDQVGSLAPQVDASSGSNVASESTSSLTQQTQPTELIQGNPTAISAESSAQGSGPASE